MFWSIVTKTLPYIYLELAEYALQTDPGQLNNVAGLPEYAKRRRKLIAVFEREVTVTYDPTVLGRYRPTTPKRQGEAQRPDACYS
jgi:hypothetical protein